MRAPKYKLFYIHGEVKKEKEGKKDRSIDLSDNSIDCVRLGCSGSSSVVVVVVAIC